MANLPFPGYAGVSLRPALLVSRSDLLFGRAVRGPYNVFPGHAAGCSEASSTLGQVLFAFPPGVRRSRLFVIGYAVVSWR